MDKIWKALVTSLSGTLKGKIQDIYHVIPPGAKPPYGVLSLGPHVTSNQMPPGFERQTLTGTFEIWSKHKGLQELSTLMPLVHQALEATSFVFPPSGTGFIKVTDQKVWDPDPKLYPLRRGTLSFTVFIRG